MKGEADMFRKSMEPRFGEEGARARRQGVHPRLSQDAAIRTGRCGEVLRRATGHGLGGVWEARGIIVGLGLVELNDKPLHWRDRGAVGEDRLG
jgi:hypothetical protein